MKNFELGGIEIVSRELANYFAGQGHEVCFFTFESANKFVTESLRSDIKIFTRKDKRISKANIAALRKVLINRQIDIIINQWGLPFVPTLIAKRAAKGLNVRYISVYHNSPDTNARIQDTRDEIDCCTSKCKRLLLNAKLRLFTYITRLSMRYVYRHSDAYVVLSPSFVASFSTFTGIRNPKKIRVITNPLTITPNIDVQSIANKKQEIIYVGRMDDGQKRVGRIIDVWSILQPRHPEWTLRFVGDGTARQRLEQIVRENKIKNVSFEGFCPPAAFYKSASMLIQTSAYEGLPLVLAEAMSFGAVPIVYGSYTAAYDIIESGRNGVVIPKTSDALNVTTMADAITSLINTPEKLYAMAEQAEMTSHKYHVSEIYHLWEELFNETNC